MLRAGNKWVLSDNLRTLSTANGRRARSIAGGFTLLEVLVVMLLASLLMVLVPARFSAVLPGISQEAEVRQFIAALRSARLQAVRERKEVKLLLDLKQREYHMADSVRVHPFSRNFAVSYVPAFPSAYDEFLITISFFPDGSSTGGVANIVAEDETYNIHVDWLTGKVDYLESL